MTGESPVPEAPTVSPSFGGVREFGHVGFSVGHGELLSAVGPNGGAGAGLEVA
jgi:ABC-type branched-subunit amino acid transport system ATPase component